MSSSHHDIPGSDVITRNLRAHAAATATEQQVLFRAPYAMKLNAAYVTYDAAITGADTNSTSITVINGGQAGAGTTAMTVAKDYLATPATNEVAGTPSALTLSATDANTNIAAGDVLLFKWTKVGTGLAIGVGILTLHLRGN